MASEEIVDEGDDGHDSCGGCIERETREPLDEAGYQSGGKMGGEEEGIHQAEESRAVFGVQEIGVKERIQLCVELWVVQVLFLDQVEEAREGEERCCASNVVGVC